MITEKEVVSSQIKKVGYDEEKKELFITFNNGKNYKYSNISADDYRALIGAHSIGGYFGRHIKNNTNYQFVLVS